MPLILGAISPHPPLLIPKIGGQNLSKIKSTSQALLDLEGELYNLQPDTLILISSHSPAAKDSFSVNLAPKFRGRLEEFEDFETQLEFHGDSEIISALKEITDSKNIPLKIISQENLDHGLTVPLFYLAQHLPKTKIVPLSFSQLDLDAHYRFGQAIKQLALESNKRLAIIASGDLSHRLTSDAPAGYAPEGETFDRTLIKLLEQKDASDILKLNPKLIEQAGECGLRSIVILLGALDKLNYDVKILSYQGPFGVGYLVAQFILK